MFSNSYYFKSKSRALQICQKFSAQKLSMQKNNTLHVKYDMKKRFDPNRPLNRKIVKFLQESRVEKTKFSDFVKKMDAHKVKDVYIPDNLRGEIEYTEKLDNDVVIRKRTNVAFTETMYENMFDKGVSVEIITTSLFSSFTAMLIMAAFTVSILNKMRMNMFTGDFQMENEEDSAKIPDASFKDIAGIEEVMIEVNELVDFIKNADKYHAAGAVIPKGYLLYGSPGTGKTMIARAVAAESKIPFISCSASEFVELFVGMGALRVRKMFEKARKQSPCIIFIDEIDAIGKRRSSNASGNGNDEREQTLNQILTEMDGFKQNDDVYIIAATNRLDTLDSALLRPGRFDRKIYVPLPNLQARKEIIDVYVRDKNLDEDVSLDEVARRAVGLSGADLKNIVNEAAIHSVREKSDVVRSIDFQNSIDKIFIGLQRKASHYTEDEKMRIAIHEIGHALTSIEVGDYDTIDKISIMPTGQAAGVTTFVPSERNADLYTYKYLLNKIKVALGGHAAEELFYGIDGVSTGAQADFQQVASIGYQLVENLGYGNEIGKLSIEDHVISDGTRKNIDSKVKRIVAESYHDVLEVLRRRKSFIKLAATKLVKKEVMSGSELETLMQ